MGLRRDKTPSRFAQLDRKAAKAKAAVEVNGETIISTDGPASNVLPLPSSRAVKSSVAGCPALHLVFPVSHGVTETLDASYLLRTPHLAEAMSTAFLKRFATHTRKTRISSNKWLRLGFFEFLKHENKEDLSLDKLHSGLIHDYIRWLNRVDPNSGKAVWEEGTRSSYYKILGVMIEALTRIPKWRKQIPADFSVPTHQWPGRSRNHTPTPIVQDEDFALLYRACLTEMSQVREAITADLELLRRSVLEVPKNPTTSRDYAHRGVALAAMDEIFAHTVPSYPQLLETHSYLLTAIKNHFGTVLKLRSVLAPSPRDLVPFVLMLAIHTRLNPEALLGSNQEDFGTEDRLGERRFRSRVNKGRARRKQMPSSPVEAAYDNPHSIIEFLNAWTKRLRKLAKPEIAKRLLIFVPRTAFSGVSFFDVESGIGNTTWTDALRDFREDHNLKRFTLQQLRPTTLDIGRAIHDNDVLAAQALGDHRSQETTNSHYTSGAQRERNAERLGEISTFRRRWIDTGGKADPRNAPMDIDEGAVTPGWGCLDPYNSPYSPHGKLCSAFGRCPACQLTQLDIRSVYAAAQSLNLLDAVRRARETMDPQGWLERMAPVEKKLVHFWLPQFSPEILEQAKALNLPPLPTPD